MVSPMRYRVAESRVSGKGQADLDDRSPFGRGGDVDPSPESFDEPGRDGKAEAGAPVGPLRREERLEDPGQHLGRDARSFVRHAQHELAALTLGYFSNLFAGTTHYGTGPAPVYFGSGYVEMDRWWKLGFVVSLVHLVVWLGAGALWWKVLGLW